MRKEVSFPNFLPGLLALLGWVFILTGAAAALIQYTNGGDALTAGVLVFGGVYVGVQQFALAAIVTHLRRLREAP